MELLAAILGVPWQQWAALAAAAWLFALVCFAGAFARRSGGPASTASSTAIVLFDRGDGRRSNEHGQRAA
jgi:hypothetical protein